MAAGNIAARIANRRLVQLNKEAAADRRSEYQLAHEIPERIEKWMTQGGRPALEDIKKYGRTEKGEPFDWTPVTEQAILISADLRFANVVDTGCSQASKTTSELLIFIYYISEGQINCAWFYDTWGNLRRNVPEQFQPMAKHWTRLRDRERPRRAAQTSVRNLERYTMGNATAIFSNANSGSGKGKEVATGSGGVAFRANILFMDEESQYPPGSDFSARLQNSYIQTMPERPIGTPGAGAGIERHAVDANYYFYPHIDCPSCGERTILDPKGALLQMHSRANGSQKEMSYFSLSGRPHIESRGDGESKAHWFHTDPDDPVETAYVACTNCGSRIPQEILPTKSYLACKKTNKTAQEVLDSIPPGVPKRPIKAVVHRSPLCRPRRINIAADLIRDGLSPIVEPRDWQQQKLGHPSETAHTKLTLEIISRAIKAERVSSDAHLVMAGCDQGTESNFLWISSMSPPSDWEERVAKDEIDYVLENTAQTTLFSGLCDGKDIAETLAQHNANFGLIDSKPGRESAAKYTRNTCMELSEQVDSLASAASLSQVKEAGSPMPCWRIRNQRFLGAVLNVFYQNYSDGSPLIRLPESWEVYLTKDSGSKKYEATPVTHLLGPWYEPANQKWHHGPGRVDDYFYACMFVQAAFYVYLTEIYNKTSVKGSRAASSKTPSRNLFGSQNSGQRRVFGSRRN